MAGKIVELFDLFRQHLEARGYIARGGQIIDASIVEAPRHDGEFGPDPAPLKRYLRPDRHRGDLVASDPLMAEGFRALSNRHQAQSRSDPA